MKNDKNGSLRVNTLKKPYYMPPKPAPSAEVKSKKPTHPRPRYQGKR